MGTSGCPRPCPLNSGMLVLSTSSELVDVDECPKACHGYGITQQPTQENTAAGLLGLDAASVWADLSDSIVCDT